MLNKFKLIGDLIDNRKKLNDDLYMSNANDVTILVNITTGDVLNLAKDYEVLNCCRGYIGVIEIKTMVIQNVSLNNVKGSGIFKEYYIKLSRGCYYGIRFGTNYADAIKAHVIIMAMVHGDVVFNAIGVDRTHDIHHKVPWSKTKDNSIDNLEIISIKEHNEIHDLKKIS